MAHANGREPKGDRRPAGVTAKMMLAFVIRQCEIDLGHPPTAAELARWSNNGGHTGRRFHLFGRPITESEARLMLKRRARLVSVRAAEMFAPLDTAEGGTTGTVVPLAAARARLTTRRRRPTPQRARPERRRV